MRNLRTVLFSIKITNPSQKVQIGKANNDNLIARPCRAKLVNCICMIGCLLSKYDEANELVTLCPFSSVDNDDNIGVYQ